MLNELVCLCLPTYCYSLQLEEKSEWGKAHTIDSNQLTVYRSVRNISGEHGPKPLKRNHDKGWLIHCFKKKKKSLSGEITDSVCPTNAETFLQRAGVFSWKNFLEEKWTWIQTSFQSAQIPFDWCRQHYLGKTLDTETDFKQHSENVQLWDADDLNLCML